MILRCTICGAMLGVSERGWTMQHEDDGSHTVYPPPNRRAFLRWLSGIVGRQPAPLPIGGPIPSVRERIDFDPFSEDEDGGPTR